MRTVWVFSCRMSPGREILTRQYRLDAEDPAVVDLSINCTDGQVDIRMTLDVQDAKSACTVAHKQANRVRTWFAVWTAEHLEPPKQVEPSPPSGPWRYQMRLLAEEPPGLPPVYSDEELVAMIQSSADMVPPLVDAFVSALGYQDAFGQFIALWGITAVACGHERISEIDDFLAAMGVVQDRPNDHLKRHPVWTHYGELRNRLNHMNMEDVMALTALRKDVSAALPHFRRWVRDAAVAFSGHG